MSENDAEKMCESAPGTVCIKSKYKDGMFCCFYATQNATTEISIPPILHKQGRPKGYELTVIGLPAKKNHLNDDLQAQKEN